MIKAIMIEYDHIDNTVRIAENDFTNLEAFGVLQAAMAMIANGWLNDDNEGVKES